MRVKYKVMLSLLFVLALAVLIKDVVASRIFEDYIDNSTYISKKGEYPLTVKVVPRGAVIKIMNIFPKYTEGMILPSGRYDLKIYMNGYKLKRLWIQHNGEEPHDIKLIRIK